MRVQTIRFDDRRRPRPRDKIGLGFEGDNLVERLEFILPQIAEAQTAQLMMGGRYANAVLLQRGGETYYADLTAEIVGTDGEVEAYVQINGSDGEAWHSDVLRLITGALPDVETEIETRYPTAVETMLSEIAGHRAEMDETLKDAEAAADKAEAAVVNPPIVGSNGNWWLWDFDAGEYVDSGKPSQGGGGATYHSQLMGRDADDQHPINAIAGLREELDGLGYTLPPATPDTLGGMMVGNGLNVDADGRVSVEPESGCELIEEVTLREAVSSFYKDATPDGRPYDFSRLIIKVDKPAVSTTGYMWLTVNNMSPSEPSNRIAPVSTHDANERHAWCDLSILSGRIKGVFSDATASGTTITPVQVTQNLFMTINATSINAIKYTYGNFPADTVITIFGEWRRDNETSVR